jgi:hypothetical protein
MKSSNSEGLTIVTACRNRESNLKKTINSWLSINPYKIIICDWGSKVLLNHDNLGVREYADKIDIIRVESEQWVLTWAFNEALARVDTAYALKLDCDHTISSDFLDLNRPKPGQFIRGHWINAEKGQEYINGAFLSCTTLLKAAGYYDERITTYGWDDSDLYSRLYDRSCGSSIIAKGSIKHIEQCEETRTKEQMISKEAILASSLGIETTSFLITRNRVLCGMLWPWEENNFTNRLSIRAKWLNTPHPEEEALLEYATLKAYEHHYNWNEFYKTGKAASQAYIDALYASKQDLCPKPCCLLLSDTLAQYTKAARNGNEIEKNIAKLAILGSSPDSLLRSRLDALGKIDKVLGSSQVQKQQYDEEKRKGLSNTGLIVRRDKLYIDAQHGLGNRLRTIGSAACISEGTNRELIIVWRLDDHCNCRFEDLFEYNGEVIDEMAIPDKSLSEVYNYMFVEGGEKNKLIADNSGKDIYIRSAFVLNSPHSNYDNENRFIQSLRPTSTILQLVNSVRHPNDLSVHIRMEGGEKYEHLPYEKSDNWSAEDHELISYWRLKSHYANFAKRIQQLIRKGRADKIFVAADNPEAYTELEAIFSDRIVWLQRNVYDRSSEQMQYALADAILLSKAPLLLGSSWSSFSELAQRLTRGWMRTEICGIDF